MSQLDTLSRAQWQLIPDQLLQIEDDDKPVHDSGRWRAGCFFAQTDKRIQSSASVCGSYFVDQNCHQIDVVSGCGKNAKELFRL